MTTERPKKLLFDIQTLAYARSLCQDLRDDLNRMGAYSSADEVERLIDIFTDEINYSDAEFAGAECARNYKYPERLN